jgi:hypothetical protein
MTPSMATSFAYFTSLFSINAYWNHSLVQGLEVRLGSSGTVSALQAQSPEFKLQSNQKNLLA